MICFEQSLLCMIHNSIALSEVWKEIIQPQEIDRVAVIWGMLCVESWSHKEPDVTMGPPVLQSHFLQKHIQGSCQGLDTILNTGWDTIDRICALSLLDYSHETDPWKFTMHGCHKSKYFKVRLTAQRGQIIDRYDSSFPSVGGWVYIWIVSWIVNQTRNLRSLRDRLKDFHSFFNLRYISNLEHIMNEEEILVRNTRQQWVVGRVCHTRSLTSLLK